jgi:hypothetical protein
MSNDRVVATEEINLLLNLLYGKLGSYRYQVPALGDKTLVELDRLLLDTFNDMVEFNTKYSIKE